MASKNEVELLRSRIKELELEIIKRDSEKKDLVEVTKKNEEILRNILEHSTNAFYSHTIDHELTFLSPQVTNILGYTPEDALIKWTELTTDNPINEEGYNKTVAAIETGKVQEPYELELIHKNGKKVFVKVHEAPVVKNGKTVAIVGSLTDITDQKLAGQGLQESEEKFRLLFEKSKDPILIIDGYNFIECNRATIETLGYNSVEELCNIHPANLSPKYQPDGRLSSEKSNEMMDIAYKTGYHRFEWIHSTKNGRDIYSDVALTKIPYKGKEMLFTSWRDISKQKEYEKSIIESEKKYSILFEQAADGILVGIEGGEIVAANESMLKLTAYKKEELIGKNISVLFEKEELGNKPLRYDLVKKGETVIRERNIVRKDGKLLPIEMNTKLLDDGRMQALIRDISKRREAEQEIINNRSLLEKAELVAGLGRYYYDLKRDAWESSEILNSLFGINTNYKKNLQNWLNIVHPDFREEMKDYFINEVIKNRKQFDKIYKIIRLNDKKERWVHGYGEIEYSSDDQPVKMIGTIQDITERKESEIALKESEAKYRNIFYNSPLGILHYDVNGVITDCNQHFVNIIGSSREKLIGLNMLTDLDNKKIVQAVKDSINNGKSYYEDWYTSITANKSTFVRILFKSLKEINNKTVSGIGLIEDITERKLASDSRKLSEENFRNIFNNSSDIIMILNQKGEILNVNESLYTHLGYTVDEFVGKVVNGYVLSSELSEIYQRIKKMYEKQKVPVRELNLISKKGEEIPFEVNSKLIHYEGKDAVLSIIRNIKERKELEQRIFEIMIETEEKERQRLASDIHDEVGPLLSSLKMYIESFDISAEKEKQEYIKSKLKSLIKESITNVRDVSNALSPSLLMRYGIVKALKSFFNNQKELINISFNSNIKNERFGIKTETVYYRILKELFNNTIKHAKANKIDVFLNYIGDKLVLEYMDNGIGFNNTDVAKYKAKGMGLSNIENRIKTINGKYKFESGTNKGFKFNLSSDVKINA